MQLAGELEQPVAVRLEELRRLPFGRAKKLSDTLLEQREEGAGGALRLRAMRDRMRHGPRTDLLVHAEGGDQMSGDGGGALQLVGAAGTGAAEFQLLRGSSAHEAATVGAWGSLGALFAETDSGAGAFDNAGTGSARAVLVRQL